MKKKYQIQGMSCGGCVNHVKHALLQITGVEDADVPFNPQTVLLTMPEPIAMEILQAELGKAGNYTMRELVH